jgi:RecG-like helicase
MSNNLLQTPIEYLKSVGPQRGELLRKELGIHRYDDLIHFFPNRYIDRTRYYKINELQKNDSEVQIIGKIIHIKTVEFGKAKKRLVATFTGTPHAVRHSQRTRLVSSSCLTWPSAGRFRLRGRQALRK